MDARDKDSERWSDVWYLFWPFLNSSGWWWLISSVFLTRTSCCKTTHANGYSGAWPRWVVSVNVLPLTEGLMLKLKFQYFGHLMRTATLWKCPWCWERLRAEEEEGVRGRDGWMTSPMQWTWTWANSGRWWGTGRPGMLQSMELQSQTWLSNWTTTAKVLVIDSLFTFKYAYTLNDHIWSHHFKYYLYINL